MAIKVVDNNGLLYFWNKIKTLLSNKVNKELKTGSTSAYKVLSDNNLTDELLTKINNAGDSTFTGSYNDLSNIPETFTPSAHSHATSEITGLEELISTKIEAVVGSAPEALDTLKELSDALGNDANFAATVTTELGNKLNTKDLSTITNDEIDTICV